MTKTNADQISFPMITKKDKLCTLKFDENKIFRIT